MGARMDQHVGLKPEAWDWLHKNCLHIPDLICPTCKTVISEQLKFTIYDTYTGMFDDIYHLKEYDLKDETKVKEILQAVPWSSGPVFYLCLQLHNGDKMFEYTEKEMANED